MMLDKFSTYVMWRIDGFDGAVPVIQDTISTSSTSVAAGVHNLNRISPDGKVPRSQCVGTGITLETDKGADRWRRLVVTGGIDMKAGVRAISTVWPIELEVIHPLLPAAREQRRAEAAAGSCTLRRTSRSERA